MESETSVAPIHLADASLRSYLIYSRIEIDAQFARFEDLNLLLAI